MRERAVFSWPSGGGQYHHPSRDAFASICFQFRSSGRSEWPSKRRGSRNELRKVMGDAVADALGAGCRSAPERSSIVGSTCTTHHAQLSGRI